VHERDKCTGIKYFLCNWHNTNIVAHKAQSIYSRGNILLKENTEENTRLSETTSHSIRIYCFADTHQRAEQYPGNLQEIFCFFFFLMINSSTFFSRDGGLARCEVPTQLGHLDPIKFLRVSQCAAITAA